MKSELSKQYRLQEQKKYYRKLTEQITKHIYPLNQELISNPFLNDRDQFITLKHQLCQYNQRVKNDEILDQYQAMSFQKIHSILCDIAQIDTKADQLIALQDLYAWFIQQKRLIDQRKNQGNIRYLCTKQHRGFKSIQKAQQEVEEIIKSEIPSQLVDRLLGPYKTNSRTVHKQLDIPIKRLSEYKRKIISIRPIQEDEDYEKQPSRIIYSMPIKYQPVKDQEDDAKEEGAGEPNAFQQIKQENKEQQQQKKQQQQQQDLGGFGQEPEQPQEQEPPEDKDDKLAPKNKIFTVAVTVHQKDKVRKFKSAYMHYKGNQNVSQREAEELYNKFRHKALDTARLNIENIQVMQDRARRKSKIQKQLQRKSQHRMMKPKYSLSTQDQPIQEMLPLEDQIRLGFTTSMRNKPKNSEITLDGGLYLPKIDKNILQEKSIRRDRLNSLRNKYSKLLQLTEYEDRQPAASMCQATPRCRGFSQIIRNNSQSKQRLKQLQQVSNIKQKLARNKVGLDMKALSHGLCIPDSEQQKPDMKFSEKQLPSNPFMVETKKKKKKK